MVKKEHKANWSKFNFLNEETGFLYNSYSNCLFQLDKSILKELKCLMKSKSYCLSKEEICFLKENKVIDNDDEASIEVLHHQSLSRIYNKKHLVLTIAPTQNCNFDCKYCFEKWRTPGKMNDNVEDAIINYLKEQKKLNGLESISLTWYGGEPLLEKERILSLGSRIKKLGFEMLENEIITNGYLFDEKCYSILSEIEIESVQITIDGFEELHNQKRPLIGGKPTFDTIVKNLDNFFKSNYKNDFLIAIRVNVDKSDVDHFLSTRKWLKERYSADNLVVYPGWIHRDEAHPSRCNCLSRNEATDVVLNLYEKENIQIEELYPGDISFECLVRNPYSIIIGWKGEMYKCYEDIGVEELIIGNILDKQIWSNIELIAKYSVGLDHFQDPTCRACPYLPICHGGCPKRRYENKYEGKNNDCCTPFKGRLDDYINLLTHKD
ncbi:MAG: SPASM domain-containing protein [Clostridia bacterium]|nr:SPASM domain-containing protein [Clostridia bacterium]